MRARVVLRAHSPNPISQTGNAQCESRIARSLILESPLTVEIWARWATFGLLFWLGIGSWSVRAGRLERRRRLVCHSMPCSTTCLPPKRRIP